MFISVFIQDLIIWIISLIHHLIKSFSVLLSYCCSWVLLFCSNNRNFSVVLFFFVEMMDFSLWEECFLSGIFIWIFNDFFLIILFKSKSILHFFCSFNWLVRLGFIIMRISERQGNRNCHHHYIFNKILESERRWWWEKSIQFPFNLIDSSIHRIYLSIDLLLSQILRFYIFFLHFPVSLVSVFDQKKFSLDIDNNVYDDIEIFWIHCWIKRTIHWTNI